MSQTESAYSRVRVRYCTCTTEKPHDHRTVEKTLIKYEDGTYGIE